MAAKKVRPESTTSKADADAPSPSAWWWGHYLERVTRAFFSGRSGPRSVTRARALELHDALAWELDHVLENADDPQVAVRVSRAYRETLGGMADADPQASVVHYLVENARAFDRVYKGRSRVELEAASATVEACAWGILARVAAELCLDGMTEEQAAEIVPWLVEASRRRLGGGGIRPEGPSRETAKQWVRAKLAAVAPDLELIRTESSADATRRRKR